MSRGGESCCEKSALKGLLRITKAKTLDTQGDYQLLTVELSSQMTDCRFLKMNNPSIGVWHVEGVHPTCETVQQAINWRKSGNKEEVWNPEVLT